VQDGCQQAFKRRNHMPSVKQIQNRLLNKKNSMNKNNLDMTTAEKGKNKLSLRILAQDKDSLNLDIQRLERQLILEKKAEKVKTNNPGR
jgi:hypothetical protein